MNKNLITTIEIVFKFFEQPNRIGDVIEYEDIEYLIIGIEQVEISMDRLNVIYTCQNLGIVHRSQPNSIDSHDCIEFYIDIDLTKLENFFYSRDLINIGRVFEYEGDFYRWTSYSDIEIEFMTLRISAIPELVRPVSNKKVRKKLLGHKLNKVGFTLI